jgi:hypothetical protein
MDSCYPQLPAAHKCADHPWDDVPLNVEWCAWLRLCHKPVPLYPVWPSRARRLILASNLRHTRYVGVRPDQMCDSVVIDLGLMIIMTEAQTT